MVYVNGIFWVWELAACGYFVLTSDITLGEALWSEELLVQHIYALESDRYVKINGKYLFI